MANSIMKTGIILLSIFIYPNIIVAQPTLSKSIDTYIKGIITYDSAHIVIKERGKIRGTYNVAKGYYLRDVYYDRITGLLSFNKCRTIIQRKINKGWTFELIVWDYSLNKTWIIEKGRSRDGEGMNSSHLCNYQPTNRSGFKITYGWESMNTSRFVNGKSIHSVSLPGGCKNLMAIINRDSILVQLSDEAMDGMPFYLYNCETGVSLKLDSQEVYKFSGIMLFQFGKNIHYFYHPNDSIDFWRSDWNPKGNAVVYSILNLDSRKYEYYFYDLINDRQKILYYDEGVIPIWK